MAEFWRQRGVAVSPVDGGVHHYDLVRLRELTIFCVEYFGRYLLYTAV